MNDLHKQLLSKLNSPVTKDLKKEVRELTKAEIDFQADYDFTRSKQRELIKQTEEAIAEFTMIAMETKEPSAFRVLGELIAILGDLNSKVIDAAKQKSEIDSTVNGGVPKSVTQNNTIYVGTAQDLLDVIEQEEENQKSIEAEVIE